MLLRLKERCALAAWLKMLLLVVRVTSQPFEPLPPLVGECVFWSGCSCSSGNRSVDCRSQSWPAVPSAVRSSVVWLSVSGLQQPSLGATRLRDYTALRSLALTDGLLSEVPRSVFSGLLQLETLILSRNRLSVFPTDVFINNIHLKKLILSGNRITLPSSGTFLQSESLQYLDISNCYLSKLPPEVFRGVPQLKELHLGNNDLLEFPSDALRPLTNLKSVYPDVFSTGSSTRLNMQHYMYISFITATIIVLLFVAYKAATLLIEIIRCHVYMRQTDNVYFEMGTGNPLRQLNKYSNNVDMMDLGKAGKPPLPWRNQPQHNKSTVPSPRRDPEYYSTLSEPHLYEPVYS